MKNIFLYMVLSLAFIACDKDNDTEGISSITSYGNFVMEDEGEAEVKLGLGDSYTDKPVTATEEGMPLTVTVKLTDANGDEVVDEDKKISLNIDTTIPGVYTYTYSAENSDGYSNSISRRVLVLDNGDFKSSIKGLYTSTVARGGKVEHTDLSYISIVEKSAGVYDITCGLGGYYRLGRNYGDNYLAPATITMSDISTGEYSYIPFPVGLFGGATKITSFEVIKGEDDEPNIIKMVAEVFGSVFESTLTQVN